MPDEKKFSDEIYSFEWMEGVDFQAHVNRNAIDFLRRNGIDPFTTNLKDIGNTYFTDPDWTLMGQMVTRYTFILHNDPNKELKLKAFLDTQFRSTPK
jgi:hypothetical protein